MKLIYKYYQPGRREKLISGHKRKTDRRKTLRCGLHNTSREKYR